MEIVEIWQNLEKNAIQIMIFLSHYMWAENNYNRWLVLISVYRQRAPVKSAHFRQTKASQPEAIHFNQNRALKNEKNRVKNNREVNSKIDNFS